MTTLLSGEMTTTGALLCVYNQQKYVLEDVAGYLSLLNQSWRDCAELANDWASITSVGVEGDATDLHILRLQIASPLEVLVSPETVAAGSAAWYAIHLLRKVLDSPEKVGSWLPRVVASWRREWASATAAEGHLWEARMAEVEAKAAAMQRIAAVNGKLIREVRVIDVDGDEPEELKDPAALEALPRFGRHAIDRIDETGVYTHMHTAPDETRNEVDLSWAESDDHNVPPVGGS